MTDRLEARRALAVYGTLGPGESNHHVVADIEGRWATGSVRGHRFQARWRDMSGYPGFRADPQGPEVAVLILVSDSLDLHWDRLDEFEGPGYRRREIDVFEPDGDGLLGRAFIYETLVEILG